MFKDITTATLAVIGVRIAWLGLTTWKRQISWQTDHDLARRLLVEIYRFRDAVAAARNPFVWAHEMRDDGGASRSALYTAEESHARLLRAFQRRFNNIGETGPKIYALLLEAEAVWGVELSTLWKELNRLQNELSSQTQLYLEYSDPANKPVDEANYYEDKETREAARRIVYSNGEADGLNEFSNRFSTAFTEVENYLRTKVGRVTP